MSSEQRWWSACARAASECCGPNLTAAEQGLLEAADKADSYEQAGATYATHQFYAVAVAVAMSDPRTAHLFHPPREETQQ